MGRTDNVEGIYRAALWTGTSLVDLGATTGNTHSQATSVNNYGVVVGWSETRYTADPHATAWSSGEANPLGSWNYSVAHDINESGKVVGYGCDSFPYAVPCFAVSWEGTTPIVLASLGEVESVARAINGAGAIVGWSYTCDSSGICNYRATLWEGSTVKDLNEFRTARALDWSLWYAKDINDGGSIVGDAFNTVTGEWRAFLLTPLKDKKQCRAGGWIAFDFASEVDCTQWLKGK